MSELFETGLSDATSMIRSGEISPVELMESLLSRSASLESKLHVWVTLDEQTALNEAKRRQEDLTSNHLLGPLHGVPVGVKDIFYTKGIKTTACSPLRADFVPSFDAAAVERLKRAGAIMMGKTVTTEWAFADPPPTRNPWDETCTPGGSSSGSAVGTAARIFPAALGTQTAGSVLRPASFNGVVGMKPTLGRISRYGVMPFAWSLDTVGLFVRSVRDAALLLSVLAGHDPRDGSSPRASAANYQEAITAEKTPRIGIVQPQFHAKADPEVWSQFQDVIRKASEAGSRVDELSLSTDFESLLTAHRLIMSVEVAAVHEKEFAATPHKFGTKLRALLETGVSVSALSYNQAQQKRKRFRQEAVKTIRGYDVLIAPTANTPAPQDLTTTGDPSFQAPWTSCGFPSLSLPSGLTNAGMPLGIQLISAPFAEHRLLETALWLEEVLGVSLEPPPPV